MKKAESNLAGRFSPERRRTAEIGSICFFAYTAVYAGKSLLGAVLPQMLEQSASLGNTAGRMGSFFLLFYGVGQLINGFLGNRISAKYMVAVGLTAAGGILLLTPFLTSPFLAVFLWGICGFCSSMLWGPISATVGENTHDRAASFLLTSLTVASVLGSLIASFFAVCSAAVRNWKLAFYLAGTLMIVSAVAWFLFYSSMERKGKIRSKKRTETLSEGAGEDRSSFRNMLCAGFFLAVLLTVCNGVIRNAVSLWMTAWMHQYLGFSLSGATAYAAILPIINVITTFSSLWLLRRMQDREKAVSLLLGIVGTACFLLAVLLGVRLPWLSVVAIFLAMACAIGVCNMIFSKYILRYRRFGKISGVSGFFDFVSYISASASNLWFSALLERDAWTEVMWIWVAVSAGSALMSLASLKAREVEEPVIKSVNKEEIERRKKDGEEGI